MHTFVHTTNVYASVCITCRSSSSAHSGAQFCPDPIWDQPSPLPTVCYHGAVPSRGTISPWSEPHADFIWCGTRPLPSLNPSHPSCLEQHEHCLFKPSDHFNTMDAPIADTPSHPSLPSPPSHSSLHSHSVPQTTHHHATGNLGKSPPRTKPTATPSSLSIHHARKCYHGNYPCRSLSHSNHSNQPFSPSSHPPWTACAT